MVVADECRAFRVYPMYMTYVNIAYALYLGEIAAPKYSQRDSDSKMTLQQRKQHMLSIAHWRRHCSICACEECIFCQ